MASSKPAWLLYAIIGCFVILAMIYAWATPIFEASDELWHFGVVEHIVTEHKLPVQEVGQDTPWEQEGSQPPLYYALASLLVAPLDLGDFDTLRESNPHAKTGIPHATDNKNLVLHDEIHPPLKNSVLAVYLVRLLSIVLGAGTVWAIYHCTRFLAPERPSVAVLAAGLTAFNPMFLFITASVNNDNLAIFLSSVILWQMLAMIRDTLSTRRSMLLAILLALVSLSKLSGLVLIPVVALAGLWVALRDRDRRGLLVLAGSMIIVWGVLAGWWYVRNLRLYDELFGTQMMVDVAGPRLENFTFQTLRDEFQGFRISFWGLFGAVNVLTYQTFYDVMDAVTVLGIIGLAYGIWQRRQQRDELIPIGLLALCITIGSIGVIQWTAQTYASQGRLLFPYLAAISGLLALGLVSLRIPALPAVGTLGVFALIVPLTSIAPAYDPPAPQAQLPNADRTVYARFDDLVLVGYQTPDRRYEPGDSVPITLYWQVLEPSERDLSLYLHAVDGDGQVIGKVDTYPGGGLLRTTHWRSSAIYADKYEVPINESATGISLLRIAVGWWHYPTETLVRATDENGAELDSVMLQVGGFVGKDTAESIDTASMTLIEPVPFGGLISLVGYDVMDDHVTLQWEATGTPPANYTVFVQIVDEANAIVGQGDAPPELPTKYWRSSEQYATQHTLYYPEPLESGTYRVLVGWYNPQDFSRLSAEYPDQAYPLTTFDVGSAD